MPALEIPRGPGRDRGSRGLLQAGTVGTFSEKQIQFLFKTQGMTTKSNSLRTAIITAMCHKQQLHGHESRYVKTEGGFCICAKCCESEYEKFALDSFWLIVKDAANKADPYLFCDNCSQRIEILKKKRQGAKERWADIGFA